MKYDCRSMCLWVASSIWADSHTLVEMIMKYDCRSMCLWVASSIWAESHTFMIDHEIIYMVILLASIESFKFILVNRLHALMRTFNLFSRSC